MATEAIIEWGRKYATPAQGPVLEVGSKNQAGYQQRSIKDIYDSLAPDWIGVDIEPGEGVDLVADLCDETVLDREGWRGHFGAVHCHCVLEHVPRVFDLCRTIEAALRPGGVLFVSVPFAWRIHRIPVDMWRFTPQSIDYLFPRIAFNPQACAISTRRGDCHPIGQPPELVLGSGVAGYDFWLKHTLKILRRVSSDARQLLSERALIMESNLMMIGTKSESERFHFFPSSIEPNGHNGKAARHE